MAIANSKSRFRALDGWRGIAAIFIVLFHMPIRESFLRRSFFDGTGLFVDFFFVLSGFVIAHAYGSILKERPSEIPIFLVRRFGRLWPLHFFVFSLFLIPNLIHLILFHWYGTSDHPPPSAITVIVTTLGEAMLLQTAFGSAPGLILNGPSWSISTEFWTYIIFAYFALIPRKQQNGAICSMVLISILVLFWFSPNGMNSDDRFGFFRCFYGFFSGQLLYRCFTSTILSNCQREWRASVATILEIAVVLILVTFISSVKQTKLGFASPIIFSALIYIFAAERGLISKLLLTKSFQKLGLYSYSIYMIHALFIVTIVGSLRIIEKLCHIQLIREDFFPGTSRVGYFIHFGDSSLMVCFSFLTAGLVVYAASWTYRLIECPGQKYFGLLADSYRKGRTHEPRFPSGDDRLVG